MPCMLINKACCWYLHDYFKPHQPSNVTGEDFFHNAEAKSNVQDFLNVCKNQYYENGGDLFTCESLYTDDITEKFLKRIARV